MILLGVLSACGSHAHETAEVAPASAGRVLKIQVGKGAGGGSLLQFNGVQIEVERDVTLSLPAGFSLSITTGGGKPIVDQNSGPEVLVDGLVLDVVAGELSVGDESFGLMAADDLVRINSEGVWVNDELRRGSLLPPGD